jgi:hypothetical protein
MLENVIMKLLSGRFLLTVTCGLVFAYATVNKLIPTDATISILTMVFVSYFQRTDRVNPQQPQIKQP